MNVNSEKRKRWEFPVQTVADGLRSFTLNFVEPVTRNDAEHAKNALISQLGMYLNDPLYKDNS